MGFDQERLAKEVQRAWGREAARDPRFREKVGPLLKLVCGITEEDQNEQIRMKVRETVERCVPEEKNRREALLAGLAATPEARQSTLGLRLEWLGSELHASSRTLRRRMEEGRDLFAAKAAASASAPEPESAHRELAYTISLFDGCFTHTDSGAIVDETRRILARRAVKTVECWVGVPGEGADSGAPEVNVEVLSNGADCRDVMYRKGAIGYALELRRPLEPGQLFDFKTRCTIPPDQPLHPRYAVRPVTPFQSCAMQVVFNPRRPPAAVWRVNGAILMEPEYRSGDLLCPDPAGRVREEFHHITQGRSYGVAWRWD